MQNQQLENDIRTLRGQLEEQANDIEQLKKDLANRYTDLDQRLELLHQKVDPDSATQDDSSNATSDNTTPASAPAPQTTESNKVAAAPATQTSEQQPSAPTTTTQPAPAAAQNQSNSLELEKAAYTVALDAYKQGGAKSNCSNAKLYKTILIVSIQVMLILVSRVSFSDRSSKL